MSTNRGHGKVGRLDHPSMKFQLSLDLPSIHHTGLVTIYQLQLDLAVNRIKT